MADDGFNGTTVSVTGSTAAYKLLSVTHDDAAAEVDLTGAAGTAHIYVGGLPNETLTLDVVGRTTDPEYNPGTASTGAITVNWFDGSTDTFAKGICVGNSGSGALDGPITSSITYRRAST